MFLWLITENFKVWSRNKSETELLVIEGEDRQEYSYSKERINLAVPEESRSLVGAKGKSRKLFWKVSESILLGRWWFLDNTENQYQNWGFPCMQNVGCSVISLLGYRQWASSKKDFLYASKKVSWSRALSYQEVNKGQRRSGLFLQI